ncbi:uncharacterized protein LOC131428440 [Malaya genurostris]|uniref:uncharacterized protein LOC131428440 n=1 Tax=Malaya genurostris TaxID=325434 RepID=UPI0026F38265|nr:uncharacterized protein LOC131428440 [Malaya genurostris]
MNSIIYSILLGLAAISLATLTEKQQQTLNFIIGKCAEGVDIELNSNFTTQWEHTGDLFPDEEKSQAAYTEKQQEMFNFIVGKCAEEQDIELNSDFTEQWEYTGFLFPDEDKSKRFAICLARKIDVLDDDGMIKTDVFIGLLADGHDVQVLTELVNKCNTNEGDTIEDRAYNFYKCFWAEKTFDM